MLQLLHEVELKGKQGRREVLFLRGECFYLEDWLVVLRTKILQK